MSSVTADLPFPMVILTGSYLGSGFGLRRFAYQYSTSFRPSLSKQTTAVPPGKSQHLCTIRILVDVKMPTETETLMKEIE